MNNKHSLFPLFLGTTLLFGLASCDNDGSGNTIGKTDEAKAYVAEKYVNFTEGEPATLIGCADGYSNNGSFGTTWSKDNIQYDADYGMRLLLEVTDDESRIKAESGDPYIGAEMRSTLDYQYGFFGTEMKPSNVKGTASTFFLYCDNPHDEIDIEFLGQDTTKVQFNYFVNGVGHHEYMYDLGFDASEEYHHYGFYWGEKELTWYVDHQPVYRVEGDNLPKAKSKLLANHWAGATTDKNVIAWMGKVDEAECPSFCYYKSIDIADKDGKALATKPRLNEYDICPKADSLSHKDIKFRNVTAYTVADKSATDSVEVSYKKEDITSNYRCVQLDVEGIGEMRYVQYKIKNLNEADYPALCRLTADHRGESGSAQVPFKGIWKNGEVSTSAYLKNKNLEATYVLQPGEEAIMTFRWYGEDVNGLTFMFDDFGDCPVVDGKGQRDGHLIITDFKFGGVQDYVPEDTSGTVEEIYSLDGIADPETDLAPIPEGYTKLSPKFSSNSVYTVTNTEEGVEIDYDCPASNYEQVGWYGGSDTLKGARELIVTMKNCNRKEEHYQFKIKDADGGLVETCELISAPSTGRFDRFSSGSPNIPYVYVSGGRTAQFKMTLKGNAKSFSIVAAVGGVATKGKFVVKGIYGKAA